MMAAGSDEPGGAFVTFDEHGHDHRDVGKMGAAAIGRIEYIDVAAQNASSVAGLPARFDNRPNAVAHRSEMDGNVRGIGDQAPVPIEQGTGEIEPLLDID